MKEIANAWWSLVSAGMGAGAVLALQALWRTIYIDVAKRITSTIWGIRIVDEITPKFLRHHLWSGTWEVTWVVKSKNFSPDNAKVGRLYRCFNMIALEGSGTTAAGDKIPYAFVGKLSQDGSIVTGTWFDRRGAGGYHGVYQLVVAGSGNTAVGLWVGFSRSKVAVRSGELRWVRISD
jgi:hypothetical protein